MTAVILLEQLKAFTEEATKDLIMPTKMQKGDTEQTYRAAVVHKMRLPDSGSATKKAPYIIHQVITGKDTTESQTKVRSIFCVYNENEEEGAFFVADPLSGKRILCTTAAR